MTDTSEAVFHDFMHDVVRDQFNSMDLEAIEELRAKREIPVAKLCGRAGIHQTTYDRWRQFMKTGEGALPNLRTLNRVRGALKELASQKDLDRQHAG